jgi:hypothetical protein
MTTVASRTFRSTPYRDAFLTWKAIVELLTQGNQGEKRNTLLAVEGIASSVIADQAPKVAPIIVTCEGPRTRIYCVYDDSALDDSGGNEDSLGFDPLRGEWQVSLPCHSDELLWVQNALKKYNSRITARELSTGIQEGDGGKKEKDQPLIVDVRRFLGS